MPSEHNDFSSRRPLPSLCLSNQLLSALSLLLNVFNSVHLGVVFDMVFDNILEKIEDGVVGLGKQICFKTGTEGSSCNIARGRRYWGDDGLGNSFLSKRSTRHDEKRFRVCTMGCERRS